MQDTHTAATVALPKRVSFDTASVWVLALTAFLAAIAFIPNAPTVPFLFTKVAILAIGGLIALVLYILARLTRGNVIVPPVSLIGALWLIPLAYALSSLFSGVGMRAAFFGTELEADTFGFMLLCAALATLAALALRRADQYRIFFRMCGVAFALVVLAQVVILFVAKTAPNSLTATANVVGSFADLGMFLGLGVAIALLANRFLRIRGKMRIALYVVTGVALFLLALINSSLVWVLIALVALGLFIESIMQRRGPSDDTELAGVTMIDADNETVAPRGEQRSLIAPLVALIAALFFLIGGATLGNALSTSFGANYLDVRPSWQATFAVGSHTYASSPIFGSGPSTFGSQWLKFRDRSLNDTVFWNVDFTSGIGLIPTSFVTEGVLGALAWIAFLALFLFIGLRALLLRAPEEGYVRFVSIASFTGALYVFALSIFSVPGPVVLVIGFIMAGVFISTLRYAGRRHEWGIIFGKNPRIGFVIVFALTLLLLASVVAAYVVVERYLADVAYAEGVQALNNGKLDAADAAAKRSILFAPSDRAYQLQATADIARMQQIVSDATLSPTDAQQRFQAALTDGVNAALTATKLSPNNYQNWAVLGSVYQTVVPLNIDGAYDNAKTAYNHAVQLNPSNPVLAYTLAQLDIAHKDGTAAEADLIQAINLKHDYTQAIFLFSQLEVQQGKAKEALQAAEAAAYFAPTDPTVLFQLGILRSGNGDTQGAINALSKAVQLKPDYANARFFLAVSYALAGQNDKAKEQLQAVAALSAQNAAAVQKYLDALDAGKNPFPASSLGALGIPVPGVNDATASTTRAAGK